MPYIKQDRRHALNNWLQTVFARVEGDLEIGKLPPGPQDCGELNYVLTITCIRHDRINFGRLDARLRMIGTAYFLEAELRYQRINDLVGAFECAALELERRRPGAKKFEAITLRYLGRSLYGEFGVSYENSKIAENGDIDYGEAADAAALRAKATRASHDRNP